MNDIMEKGKKPKNWETHIKPYIESRKGKMPYKPFPKGHQIYAGAFTKGSKHKEESKLKMSIARKNRTGQKSSNWKGGITPLGKKIRMSDKYKQWRSSVFERDNYTCQKCKDTTKRYLEAHHIIKFKFLLKENSINSTDKAFVCSALWDISNGITLCLDCHKLEDAYRKRLNFRSKVKCS